MARTPTLALIGLLAAIVVAPGVARATAAPRVLGGLPALADAAPWAAALVAGDAPGARDGQFCGATVIAARAVLTAAHCVVATSPSRVEVVTGRDRLSSLGGERIAVSAYRVYPHYEPRTGRGDVAVLLLSRPTAAPALALAGPRDGALAAPQAPLTLYGWGAVSNRAGAGSDELRAGTMAAGPGAACEAAWGSLFDARVQLCAIGPARGAPDACPGDSGGPLTGGEGAARRLVGVVSFGGRRCGDARAPSVFTRVSGYAGWVVAQVFGAPADPPSRVGVRIAGVRCATTCLVDVVVSGDGRGAVAGLDVRARSLHADRVVPATRIGAARWRAGVDDLPAGRVRFVATALGADRRPLGRRAKVTLAIGPGAAAPPAAARLSFAPGGP